MRPTSKNPAATQLTDDYIKRFPDLPNNTLARKLLKDNPDVYVTLNAAVCAVRYRRGAQGRSHRETRNIYDLPTPDSTNLLPFILPQQRTLILGDLHIPYFSMEALTLALEYGASHNVKTVLFNGDFCDHHRLSFWEHDPRARDFKSERAMAVAVLGKIRKIFPKARIILKEGNHDELIQRYVMAKAPEIYDEDIFSLEHLWHLEKHTIGHVKDKRVVVLGDLNILHGHELPKGMSRPVSPSRTLYARCKAKTLCHHFHQTSYNQEVGINHEVVPTYSVGCLCNLSPLYAPINNWGHGFAIAEPDDDGVTEVQNFQISNGKIRG